MNNRFTSCCRFGIAALLAAATLPALAQTTPGVAIGTGGTAPDASAALEIASSSKGVLLPRLTEAARLAMGTGSIPAPAVGLIVYQTDGTAPGFYYASSATSWTRLTDGTTASGAFIQNQSAADQAASFRISGNGIVGGHIGIGTASPYSQLANTPDNILGSDGYGGNPGSLAWSASQLGYVAMIYNGDTGNGRNGLAVKVAGTDPATAVLDVSSGGAQMGGSTPLLKVQANGSVGIGMALPSATLDVNGTTRIRSLGAGVVTSDASGNLSSTAGVANGLFWGLGGNSGTTPSTHFIGTTDAQPLVFRTNNVERMRLRPDGGLDLLPAAALSHLVGHQAGASLTTGAGNHFAGFQAGASTTTGNGNHFEGYRAGTANTTGSDNFFLGYEAGTSSSTGSANLYIGNRAGVYANGNNNFFLGLEAGRITSTGSDNFFAGFRAGVTNTTGSGNFFAGYEAGSANSSGDNNTAVGYQAGPTSGALTNAAAFGYQAKVTQDNSLVLGGTGAYAVKVGIGTTAPTQSLDVNGNQNLTGTLKLNTADVDKIYLTSQGANGSKIGHAASWGVLNYAGPGVASTVGYHSWLTSSGLGYQERLRLTPDGRLGVGVSAPVTQLSNTSSNIIGSDGIGMNTPSLGWAMNTQGYVAAFTNGDAGNVGANGVAIKVAGTAGNALDVSRGSAGSTPGVSLLTVKNNGNVGIGTTNPITLLDVNGTLRVAGAGGAVGTVSQLVGSHLYGFDPYIHAQTFTAPATGTLTSLTLYVAGNGSLRVGEGVPGGAGTIFYEQPLIAAVTSTPTVVTFSPALALVGGQTYYFSLTNGLAPMGTSTDPAGDVYTGGGLYYALNNANTFAGAYTPRLTDDLKFVATYTGLPGAGLAVAAAGVGVGTTSPAASLHVAGTGSTVRLEGLSGSGTRVVTAAADGTLGTSAASGFIANQTTQQAGANFNISGNGTVGNVLTVGSNLAARGTLDVRNGDTFLVENPDAGTYQSVFLPGHLLLTPFSGASGTAYIQGRVLNPTASTNIGLTLRTTAAGVLTDALAIAPGGSVSTAGDVTVPAASAYKYAAAKSRSLLLGASDFRAEDGTTGIATFSNTDDMYPTTGTTPAFRAPLHLPQGAIITGITLLGYDRVGTNLTADLLTFNPFTSGARTSVASVSSSGATLGGFSAASAPVAVTVDNTALTYSLRVVFSLVNDSNMTLRGVRVSYTVTQAE